MKVKFLASMALALALLLTACGGGTSTPAAGGGGDAGSGAAATDELQALPAGLCEGPVLLTSVGQSADVSIVNTLMERAGVDSTMNATAEASALSGYNTLVLAIGGSSKGLGAAGIDENQELARVQALIAEAQSQGVTILSLHIGGSARRGTLSDKFIPDAIAAADAAIILTEGDSDNLMRDLLVANGVPAEYIQNQIDAIEPLQTLFGT